MDRFEDQFSFDIKYWIDNLDFATWYRYFYLIKSVIKGKFNNILEIGVGNNIVKNILKDKVVNYSGFDINPQLKPDFVGDLRKRDNNLLNKYDCIICSDVVEHTPFADLDKNLNNINSYLKNNGKLFLSIPHRRNEFFFIFRWGRFKTVFFTFPIWITPAGFYNYFIKKKIYIDPAHYWEIGAGKVKNQDVENKIINNGFMIESFKKLPYVDLWILKKNN